jgi:hypothetical protein
MITGAGVTRSGADRERRDVFTSAQRQRGGRCAGQEGI